MVPAAIACQHIFLETARFNELVALGVIKRAPPRGYSLDKVREQYCRHMQKVRSGRGSDDGGSLSKQRTRLATAQARVAENKAAREEGKTCDIATAVAFFGEAAAVIREILLATPGKVSDSLRPHTPEDAATIHRIIYREMLEAMANLRNPASFAMLNHSTKTKETTDEDS